MTNVSNLLNTLRKRFDIKNDSELAERLGVSPSYISRTRANSILGDKLKVQISERFGLSMKEIRDLAS